MRTRIAGGLFVSHLRSETDLKSHNYKEDLRYDGGLYLEHLIKSISFYLVFLLALLLMWCGRSKGLGDLLRWEMKLTKSVSQPPTEFHC